MDSVLWWTRYLRFHALGFCCCCLLIYSSNCFFCWCAKTGDRNSGEPVSGLGSVGVRWDINLRPKLITKIQWKLRFEIYVSIYHVKGILGHCKNNLTLIGHFLYTILYLMRVNVKLRIIFITLAAKFPLIQSRVLVQLNLHFLIRKIDYLLESLIRSPSLPQNPDKCHDLFLPVFSNNIFHNLRNLLCQLLPFFLVINHFVQYKTGQLW